MVFATSPRFDSGTIGTLAVLLVAWIGTLCVVATISIDTTTLTVVFYFDNFHFDVDDNKKRRTAPHELVPSMGPRAATTRVSSPTAVFPDSGRTTRSVL